MSERCDKTVHQGRFLAAFSAYVHVGMACRAAGVTRSTHYRWLEQDEDYARRFAETERKAARVFVDEAIRRGVHGVDRPVRHKGRVVGKIREYSDGLLLAVLKAKVDEFRDRMDTTLTHRLDVDSVREFMNSDESPDE